MANRAYLYTANKDFTKIRDVSEFPTNIPFQYEILLGVNTKQEMSRIWGNNTPIAISGDFKLGLEKFMNFYEYLQTQENLDKNMLKEAVKKTLDFFEKYPEKNSDLFFMEAGEIYDLIPEFELGYSNNIIYNKILKISADIDEILRNKPKNLFSLTDKYAWLEAIRLDDDLLQVYWRRITYFSFNES